jgi:hypothetical protein
MGRKKIKKLSDKIYGFSMKKVFLFCCLLAYRLYAEAPLLFDLEAEGQEQYQDIYVQGAVLKKASYNERFMEERFKIVHSILQRYKRPFTLLDIGAAQGYFSMRAAEIYPESVFVMMEGSNAVYPQISKQLGSICELNHHLGNLIWLDKPLILEDLKNIRTCEHFDVVLLLNIVHWFPNQWKEIIDIVYSMSHLTILEVPPIEPSLPSEQLQLRKQIHAYLSTLASESVQGVPRHTHLSLYTTYYILENKGPFSIHRTSLIHPAYGDRQHWIHCDYKTKQLQKIDQVAPFLNYTSDWQPGINLITYLMLQGAHPSREEITQVLPVEYAHRDWMLNNMILQGRRLVLIDMNDRKNEMGGCGSHFCTPRLREKIEKLILIKDPEKFKKEFFNLTANYVE